MAMVLAGGMRLLVKPADQLITDPWYGLNIARVIRIVLDLLS